MKKFAFVLMAGALLVFASGAVAQGRHSFSFQASSIGSASGEISLGGGGAFDLASSFVSGGGEFRCLRDVTAGPLAGCRAGEGTHWKALQILPSTGFKCGDPPPEPLKTAVTDEHTVVMVAQFFRAGDGNRPSFTATVFVSDLDLDPAQPGVQNVWVQGAGCGEADTRIN